MDSKVLVYPLGDEVPPTFKYTLDDVTDAVLSDVLRKFEAPRQWLDGQQGAGLHSR